jgi:hypothetical protein
VPNPPPANVGFAENEMVLAIENIGARRVEVFVDLKKGQVDIFERNDADVRFAVNIACRPWTICQHTAAVVWVVFASDEDLIKYHPLDVFVEIDESGRLRLNRGSVSNWLCRPSFGRERLISFVALQSGRRAEGWCNI